LTSLADGHNIRSLIPINNTCNTPYTITFFIQMDNPPRNHMKKLIDIVEKLRSPGGCPWDQKQTHSSLIPYILEETWEVINEIEQKKVNATLKEELGDLLLQIVLHSQIAREENRFTFEDVVDAISEKMIHRHPHVFKPGSNDLSEKELSQQWRKLKSEEKTENSIKDSFLTGAPSLMNALSISKKAAGMGFDWESAWDVLLKVEEELDEIRVEMKKGDVNGIEEEIGDLLFTITNLARFYKINPEIALKKGNDKFVSRFESLETAINQAEQEGNPLSIEEMGTLWEEQKALKDSSD
jgi:MazG family protein